MFLPSLGRLLANARPNLLNRLHIYLPTRQLSACSALQSHLEDYKTRNIGIIAHIDAGKTTTTERMLFYTGKTHRIGNVDEGSTVTDFLPAERARGITIQSAVVTIQWLRQNGLIPNPSYPPNSRPEHRINLIDTPGHVDFNFEVIRSLRILDGAVCILDGVAGVEAQTEGVWSQASRYHIPRIIFVNKLDREGASFRNSVLAVASRLSVRPAVYQIPWYDRSTGEFCGLVDIASLRAVRWDLSDPTGRSIHALNLDQLSEIDNSLAEEVRKARLALVELLSDYDEALVEEYLTTTDGDHMAVSEATILQALRNCTLTTPQVVVPILCGASFRNIGVQPLLDSVVDFLPSPPERPESQATFASSSGVEISAPLSDILTGNQPSDHSLIPSSHPRRTKKKELSMVISKVGCCALAFKVVNDPIRGVLVYVRVYHGSLDKGAVLYNTNLQVSEKAIRLMEMYANEAVDQPSIQAGQIGVIAGLKHARTGDTLVSYAGLTTKAGSPPPPSPLDSLQLKPIIVPSPVFFVAIEPTSPSEEKHMWDAISVLLREDPSLRVTVDSETGQAQMSGLGELHLEIATDRLINDLKARITVGPIEIGYRETVLRKGTSSPGQGLAEREVSGVFAHANSDADIAPRGDESIDTQSGPVHSFGPFNLPDENLLYIHLRADSEPNPLYFKLSPDPDSLSHIDLSYTAQTAISSGVMSSLARGPRSGYPLHSCRVDVTFDLSSLPLDDQVNSSTSAIHAALSASARAATSGALRSLDTTHSSSCPASKNGAATLGSSIGFMEPVMRVHITVDEFDMGNVIHDLASARGGHVLALDEGDDFENMNGTHDPGLDQPVYTPPDLFESSISSSALSAPSRQKIIAARVPLSEMVGYNRHLRSITRGRGAFSMQVDQFERMNPLREKKFITSGGKLSSHN